MDAPARKPYLTVLLMLVLLGAFGLQHLDPTLLDKYALAGNRFEDAPETFFTGAFLHADQMHLLGNVGALLFLGSAIEASMGRLSLLLVYAGALVGGQAAVLMWSDPAVPTVGASGAIYGLFGAVLIVNLFTRDFSNFISSLAVIGFNTVIGYMNPSISWQAHLGGLAAGTAIAVPCAIVIIAWARRRARKLDRAEQAAAEFGYIAPHRYQA